LWVVSPAFGRNNRVFAGITSEFFEKSENEYGLLENLEGWVFVEWSKANDFTEGVNFPSNMLYSGAIASAGRLYGDKALLEKAEKIKKTKH
jgi:alpha-L-rhamnosidase